MMTINPSKEKLNYSSLKHEQAYLGIKISYPDTRGKCLLSRDDFTKQANQDLYEAIEAAGPAADPILSVKERLDEMGAKVDVGYIGELVSGVLTSGGLERLQVKIQEMTLRRKAAIAYGEAAQNLGTQYPGIGPPNIHPGDDFTIPEDILESIKRGIADKLSVPVEEITIIDKKQVFWSDKSLGNPQPGGVYAQVIVPGYKITAQVGEGKHASEFYAILDSGGDQLKGIVGPDPFSGQPPGVTIPEQPFPPPPPIEKPISPPLSKWDNLRETANDDPYQKALIETLPEREAWKTIKKP